MAKVGFRVVSFTAAVFLMPALAYAETSAPPAPAWQVAAAMPAALNRDNQPGLCYSDARTPDAAAAVCNDAFLGCEAVMIAGKRIDCR